MQITMRHVTLRITLLIAFVFACSEAFSQTSVIVRLKDNEFLIGADGKVSLAKGHSTGCKILRGNGFWYSLVGLVEAIGSSFKADSLIELSNTVENLSMEKRIQKIDSCFQSLWKRTFPTDFNESLTVLIYHFTNDTAVLTRLFYENHPSLGFQSRNENCRYHCGWKFFGEHEEIDRLLDNPPSDMPSTPAQAIEYLLIKQATATPDKVGLPIDILYLNSTGYYWYKNGSCN